MTFFQDALEKIFHLCPALRSVFTFGLPTLYAKILKDNWPKRFNVQWDPRFATHTTPYLEDHPSGCKWLITMVIVSPLSRVVGPLPNGLFMAYTWGLLTTY